jgi:hypothetical protein
MRAEDVDSKIRVQQIGIVGTDHWIVIVRQNAVQPQLVFNPILAARPVFHGGFGVRHHAGQREAQGLARHEGLLDESKHGFFVKAPALETHVLRQRQLELAGCLRRSTSMPALRRRRIWSCLCLDGRTWKARCHN